MTIRSRDNEIRELKERLRMYESTPGTFAASPPKQEVKRKARPRKKAKKEKNPQVKPEPMKYESVLGGAGGCSCGYGTMHMGSGNVVHVHLGQSARR